MDKELKQVICEVFKHAYTLGREDALDGLHLCPEILCKQFLKKERDVYVSLDVVDKPAMHFL
jgi:hypothetical protein